MAQINILHPVYRTQYTTSIYILYLLVSILALFCYRFSFLLFCLSSALLGPPEGLENPTVSKRDRKKIHWVWCTSIGKDFSKFRSRRNGFLTQPHVFCWHKYIPIFDFSKLEIVPIFSCFAVSYSSLTFSLISHLLKDTFNLISHLLKKTFNLIYFLVKDILTLFSLG